MRGADARYKALVNRLNAVLSSVGLTDFLALIWATDALQSNRLTQAGTWLRFFPQEAVTTDGSSPYYIHKWVLESLAVHSISSSPSDSIIIPGATSNCRDFRTILLINGLLLEIENEESKVLLHRMNIFDEMHRLAQRQFEWQRGFSSLSQLYRSTVLFGGPECTSYLQSKRGYDFQHLSQVCFALFSLSKNAPGIKRLSNLNQVFIGNETRDAVVNAISISQSEARSLNQDLLDDAEGLTYKKSILRQYPLVRDRNLDILAAPLRELIMLRGTSNSFYDLAGSPGHVRNEISLRFEKYTKDILTRMLRRSTVKPSFKYKWKKNIVDSPDVLCYLDNNFPDIVIECKARRMTFEAKFAADPLHAASEAYDEIVAGVSQIWRYVARRRRLGLSSPRSAAGSIGILVTLDSWLTMFNRAPDLLGKARCLLERDTDIDRRDDVPVVFCTIDDLEILLRECNDDLFYQTILAAAYNKRYRGWALPQINFHLHGRNRKNNEYPFRDDLDNALPWWKNLRLIGLEDQGSYY